MINLESEIKSSEQLCCFFKDAEEQLAEYSITGSMFSISTLSMPLT